MDSYTLHPKDCPSKDEYDSLARDMRKRLPVQHVRNKPAWLNREQVAQRLHVSLRTVDRLREARELSYYRGPVTGFSTGLRFWGPDVDARKKATK